MRQTEVAGVIGMEQAGIDPARPPQDGAEAPQAQLFRKGGGGDHGAAVGLVAEVGELLLGWPLWKTQSKQRVRFHR